jgi:hypothetical protein
VIDCWLCFFYSFSCSPKVCRSQLRFFASFLLRNSVSISEFYRLFSSSELFFNSRTLLASFLRAAEFPKLLFLSKALPASFFPRPAGCELYSHCLFLRSSFQLVASRLLFVLTSVPTQLGFVMGPMELALVSETIRYTIPFGALRPTAMPESSEYTKILCLRTRPSYAFFSGLPYWR